MTVFDVALMVVTDEGERPVVATVSDTTLVADLAAAAGGSRSTTLARLGERLDPSSTLGAAGVCAGDTLRLGDPLVGDWKRLGPELRVIGGVDAGKRRRINEGTFVVGRDPGADFVLSSMSASRRHAELRWGGGELVVRDLGSRHGTYIDGHRLGADESRTVAPYTAIHIGDSVVTVAAGAEPPPFVDRGNYRVAAPETTARRSYAPFVVPSAGALAFAAAASGAPAPVTLVATPAALLAGLGVDRVLSQRAQRRAESAHAADVAAIAADVRAEAAAVARAARAQFADPAALLGSAERRSASLWSHGADDLILRIGLASQPDAVAVEADDADRRAIGDAGAAYLVPLTVTCDGSPVAVVGPEPFLDDLFTWLVAQATAALSPDDMEVLVVSDDLDRWAWTALLPHARSRVVVASNAVSSGLPTAERPRRLVVLDRVRAVDVSSHDIVLSRHETNAGRFGDGVVVRSTSPAHVAVAVGDRVPGVALADLPFDATGFALSLALHLASLGGQRNGRSALPTRVRLPEILPAVTDAAAIARGWRRASDPLVAVVGADEHSPVAVTLEGAASHVLVAGTTGAGKTRLLETLALGLASNYAPSALNLMTIDFKGGNELAGLSRLPHCVGAVSDRDPVEVDRAIAAIGRELARRDDAFAAARATDRDDYVAKTGLPMPHLVVIADEFGQFRREDGTGTRVAALLRIAAQGRSKGVHLVLATQSPSIDVNADIRQNVGVRLCLRVAEPAESVAVLGTTDAMALAHPGRVVISDSDRARVAQVALSRGPVVINDSSAQAVVVRDLIDVAAGRAAPTPSLPTELFDAVVDAITIAARTEGITTTPLLGPPLPPRIERSALIGASARWTAAGFVLAARDRPGVADAAPVSFEPHRDGSLTIVGGPRSGRTTTLLSLAEAVRRQRDPQQPVVVHAVDWGGGLDVLAGADADAGVVAYRDFDHLRRTLAWLKGDGVAGTTRLVLVDRYDVLLRDVRDVDAALATELADVLQSGPRRKVFAAVTVDPMSLVGGAGQLGGMRLVLPVDDPSIATAAGLPRRSFALPGRAIALPDGDDAQIGVPGLPARAGAPVDGLVAPMPRTVAASALGEVAGERALLGIGGEDLVGPVVVDLERVGPCFVVIGRSGSGRSTALAALARTYAGSRRVVHADRSSSFTVADPPSFVLIDDAAGATWLNDPELPNSLRAGGHVLVAAFDQADLQSLGYGHWLLRRPCPGLLLALDATSDRIVAGERVGFHPPAELRAGPPGRGWWCERGRGIPVQVADSAH
ncbi:MAG: segregation ATPase FtsK/SpoIIIE, family [Actinomycetota bacterium]